MNLIFNDGEGPGIPIMNILSDEPKLVEWRYDMWGFKPLEQIPGYDTDEDYKRDEHGRTRTNRINWKRLVEERINKNPPTTTTHMERRICPARNRGILWPKPVDVAVPAKLMQDSPLLLQAKPRARCPVGVPNTGQAMGDFTRMYGTSCPIHRCPMVIQHALLHGARPVPASRD